MKAFQIIEAAQRVCDRLDYHKAAQRFGCINSAPHYSEPGYSTSHPVILFGNWNSPRDERYDSDAMAFVSLPEGAAENAFFKRVCKALESCAELEWEDEWTTCSECGGAIRTSPDSYSWTRAYVEMDGDILCSDCAQKHAAEVLVNFEDKDDRCITADLGIDPAEHGYTKLDQQFEHGLYGGQADDPKKIAAALRSKGITRFLFTIDAAGQFDLRFSVWVHDDEKGLMPEQLGNDETAGTDPAEMMKKALKNMPPPPPGPGINYTKVDLTTGESTTRKVSPDEFIDGIKD